jgi:hypothetical protein
VPNRKYQLKLMDRLPQSRPAPGPNMDEKYNGDYGPLVLGDGGGDERDALEQNKRSRSIHRQSGRGGVRSDDWRVRGWVDTI